MIDATTTLTRAVDISKYPIVTYSGTIEVIPETEALTARIHQKAQLDWVRIWSTEQAKGASAADIFDKMMAHMKAMPPEYLQLVGAPVPLTLLQIRHNQQPEVQASNFPADQPAR